jgi:hypothetical protein
MFILGTSLQTAAAAGNISYGGRATVVDATVLGVNTVVVDTGQLPSTGGAETAQAASVNLPGVLDAGIANASTIGQSTYTRSEASVAGADLSLLGLGLEATLIRADAEVNCSKKGKASANGSSTITDLVINGQPITISGQPNQTIDLGLVQVVINEQIKSVSGRNASMTVNAIHVTVLDILGAPLADVIISHAEASITCVKRGGGGGGGGGGGCGCADVGDFVTGSGQLNAPGKPDFGVSGGLKNGNLYGHLNFNDHNGTRLTNTTITDYDVTGTNSRQLKGTGKVNGQNVTFTLDVTDNGAGHRDKFRLQLSNGYDTGTLNLQRNCGNIKVHTK